MLATVVRAERPTSARPGDKAIVTADGRLLGWIGGACAEPLVRHEAARALADGTPRLVHIGAAGEAGGGGSQEVTVANTCPSGGRLDIFVEPRLPRPLLIVFGASPVARTLVALAGEVGFRTCIVHPGADRSDFPEADGVVADLELGSLAPGPDAWAVVASMGHYDEDAVACALSGHPALRVALVASSRRAEAVISALRSRGVPEHDLARVRAPAGRVRATAQSEIALLTLAEIVTMRSAALKEATPSADAEGFATDPVCGMPVAVGEAGATATHNGRHYYFCSTGCREQFAREPERFAAAHA